MKKKPSENDLKLVWKDCEKCGCSVRAQNDSIGVLCAYCTLVECSKLENPKEKS